MLRLKTAMLFVKEFESMTRFYEQGFGFKVVEQMPGWALYDAGFALHAIPAEIAADIAITSPPVAREETPIKLVFATSEALSKVMARLTSHGATMFEVRGTRVDGLDPEGNVFCIEKD